MSKVAIVGAVRDVDKTLVSLVDVLGEGLSTHETYWFFVESNSTDSTQKCLENLAKSVHNFEYKILHEDSEMSNRLERIARARNTYLAWLRQQAKLPDAVIVVDGDVRIAEINDDFVKDFLKSDDFCWAANSSEGLYYDLFALRHAKLSPNDYRQDILDRVKSGSGVFRAYRDGLFSKQVEIMSHVPFQALSAFGGMAVYRGSTLIENSRVVYIPQENAVGLECEHVSLNSELGELTGRKLMVGDSFSIVLPGEHKSWNRRLFRYAFLLGVKLESFVPRQIRKFVGLIFLERKYGLGEKESS